MTHTTLAAVTQWEAEIKKSRFLAHAAPISSPQEALDFLSQVAEPSATHNCWAWRLGQNYRFSDDGEPASTAGKPILSAIEGQGLDAVMVVVTRWFGGIKLGAGGLVRAYGGTAAECLRRAERHTIIPMMEAHLHAAFEHAGSVHNALLAHDATKISETYDSEGLTLRIQLAAAHFEALATTLRDATRGQARLCRVESETSFPS